MNMISDILYWISTGLLVPVIVLLILLFIRSLFLIGGFFGQYLSIRKAGKVMKERFDGLTAENADSLLENLPKGINAMVIDYIRRIIAAKDNEALMNKLVSEFEIAADKDLSTSKILTKMGPMLGLMGTLIPMGPALVGLSTGDIASMAYNMQVAFATTVVGLFASAIGFITLQIKQRWYMTDMTNLDFLVETLTENK